jgi:hypothetical protein
MAYDLRVLALVMLVSMIDKTMTQECTTIVFDTVGTVQTFAVPNSVRSIYVDAYGGQGEPKRV